MIIYGGDLQIPTQLNFGEYILNHLKNVLPDCVCLENYESGKQMTYKQFSEYAVNLSTALLSLGLQKGDVVGVGSEKRITFLPATLAVVLCGAAYTPFGLDIGRAVLKHKLNLSKPTYFICSELFWNEYSAVLKDCRFIKTLICFEEIDEIKLSVKTLMATCGPVDVEKFKPVAVNGKTDISLILYSSGTTGMPKAVAFCHYHVIAAILPSMFQDESLKSAYIFGTWNNGYEIYCSYDLLLRQIKIVYSDIATPDVIFKCIRDHKLNVAALLPSIISFLAKDKEVSGYDFSSVKTLFYGGAPLYPKCVHMVKTRFPEIKNIFQLYGMTEMGFLTSELWNSKKLKPGSVGVVKPGVSLKVVDLKTREIVGPNQKGEICVQSVGLMKGYIGFDMSNYLDEQGFFLTGDLGYYDEDNYVFIVDRLKDLISYDGREVAPKELEIILMRHPDVADACVVGKPAGDLGEEPAAVVVRAAGARVTEQQLVAYVASEVSPFMQLRGGVKFMSELPRNHRGKVMRRQLTEILFK